MHNVRWWGYSVKLLYFRVLFQVISEKTSVGKILIEVQRHFYMKIIVTLIPKTSVKNLFLPPPPPLPLLLPFFSLSLKPKTRIKFLASWWSGNERYLSFYLQWVTLYFKGMPNSIEFSKEVFYVIPVPIIVSC